MSETADSNWVAANQIVGQTIHRELEDGTRTETSTPEH